MQRTNIYLDDEQLLALKHLAAAEGQSVAQLVRQAVDRLLAERLPVDGAWAARLDGLIRRIRARVPADAAPVEIEADVSAAREEVRQSRRARRR